MPNLYGLKKTAVPYAGEGFKDQFDKAYAISPSRNRAAFFLRKLRNYALQYMAYFCPLNSLRVLFHRWRGVKIGKNVFIGFGCILDHSNPEFIILEDYAMLSGENYLLTHSRPYAHFRRKIAAYVAPVHIKEGAWLGIRSTVLPGVSIGRHSVVSAGTVVSRNVPDNVVVGGEPAKIINRFEGEPE